MNMLKPVPPCKGCKDRVREDPERGLKDCHDRCDKYIEFREALDRYTAEINRLKGEVKVPEARPWIKRHKPIEKRIGGEINEH